MYCISHIICILKKSWAIHCTIFVHFEISEIFFLYFWSLFGLHGYIFSIYNTHNIRDFTDSNIKRLDATFDVSAYDNLLSNHALQKHEISKILLSIQTLFCEHWNFVHHLVTVLKKGIREQLINVYTQNIALFVVLATVHQTSNCAFLNTISNFPNPFVMELKQGWMIFYMSHLMYPCV